MTKPTPQVPQIEKVAKVNRVEKINEIDRVEVIHEIGNGVMATHALVGIVCLVVGIGAGVVGNLGMQRLSGVLPDSVEFEHRLSNIESRQQIILHHLGLEQLDTETAALIKRLDAEQPQAAAEKDK